MINSVSLKTYSTKDLAQLAKKRGVAGWHSMGKDQLIRALERSSGGGGSGKGSASATRSKAGAKAVSVGKAGAKAGGQKAISTRSNGSSTAKSTKSGGKSGRPVAVAAAAGRTSGSGKKVVQVQRSLNGHRSEKLPMAKASAAPKSGAASKSSSSAPIASGAKPKSVGSIPAVAKSASAGKASASSVSAKVSLKSASVKRVSAKPAQPPRKPTSPAVAKKIKQMQEDQERRKDLANPVRLPDPSGDGESRVRGEVLKDRIVLLVRDCYWLQCLWEITRQSVQRAQAAMAEYWHGAKPVIRLIEVEANGTTSTAERVARQIPIHGGVSTWYIDVEQPAHSFRVELGYLASSGKFFSICRSNVVTTPRPGSADAIDENWTDVAENYEKIYAQSGGYSEENNSTELQELFEERLRRPMGSPNATRFGVGAESVLNRRRDFKFDVDAEMIVFGATKPDAYVMLGGEPVKLRPDGTFTVRLSMPDKRQVIPIVASSKDGVEQRTVVLAVERNTKVMEPIMKDNSNSAAANAD